MAKRKRRPAKNRRSKSVAPSPAPLQPDPDVPTYDYLAGKNLEYYDDLEQVLEDVTLDIEMGYFLQWEAIVRLEQGQPLSQQHQEALDEIEDLDTQSRVLYINEIARPKYPWYEIIRQIVPNLVIDPFYTSADHSLTATHGWANLAQALAEHGRALSVPKGSRTMLDMVPVEVQHQLWLQHCFGPLTGLGQSEDQTLANEEQQQRIEWFIEGLRHHKATVNHFKLTLETLFQRVILPPQDEEILAQAMIEQLELPSRQAPLAKYL